MFQSTSGVGGMGGRTNLANFASTPGVQSQVQVDWSPSHPDERSYYDKLFSMADNGNAGSIAGKAAVNFFSQSGLDFGMLKQVWDVADWKGQHLLRREDFYVSMRLIAMAQAGHQLSRENLRQLGSQLMPIARFSNAPAPPNIQSGQQPAGNTGMAGGMGGVSDRYSMTDQEKTKYSQHFGNYDSNKDGFVEGPEAVSLFSKSGLPRESLSKVWELSDMDKDNKLSLHEFCVAMHLIVCVSKKNLPMPNVIPESLRDKSKQGNTISSMGGVLSPNSVLSPRDEVPLGGAALDSIPPAQAPAPAPVRPSVVPKLDLQKVSGVTSGPTSPQLQPQPMGGAGKMSGPIANNINELGEVSESIMGTAKAIIDVNQGGLEAQDSALASMKSLIQRLNAEKISLNSSLQTSKKEFLKGSEQLNEMTMEMGRLQEELKILKAEKAEQEQAIFLQNEKLRNSGNEKKALLEEIQKLTKEIEDMINEKDKIASEVHILQMNRSKLEAGTESLGMVYEEHRQDITRMQSEIEMIQQIYNAQKTTNFTTRNSVQELHMQRQDAQAALKTSQQAFDHQRAKVEQAKQEREALSQKLMEAAQSPSAPMREVPVASGVMSPREPDNARVMSPREPDNARVMSPREPDSARIMSPRDPNAPPVPPKPGNMSQSSPNFPPKSITKPTQDDMGPSFESSDDAFAAFPETNADKESGFAAFPDNSSDAFSQGNFGSSASFSSGQNDNSDAFPDDNAFSAFPERTSEGDAFGDAFADSTQVSASQKDAFGDPFLKSEKQDDAFGDAFSGSKQTHGSQNDAFDDDPFPKSDKQDNMGFQAFPDSSNPSAGVFDAAFPEDNNNAFGGGFPDDNTNTNSSSSFAGDNAFKSNSNDPFQSDAFGQGQNDAFGSDDPFDSKKANGEKDAFGSFDAFA